MALMAEINGGDPITTYKSWDDPPSNDLTTLKFFVGGALLFHSSYKNFRWAQKPRAAEECEYPKGITTFEDMFFGIRLAGAWKGAKELGVSKTPP